MTRVRINLTQLENQVKSKDIKARQERPAVCPPCQVAAVYLCLYKRCPHTWLWLLTQHSVNTAGLRKLAI